MKSVMPKWAKIKQMYTQKLDCIQIQHNTMSWTKQQYNIYDTYQWFFFTVMMVVMMRLAMMMVSHNYLGWILWSGDKRSFEKYAGLDRELFQSVWRCGNLGNGAVPKAQNAKKIKNHQSLLIQNHHHVKIVISVSNVTSLWVTWPEPSLSLPS